MRIYLAGPLFSSAEREWNQRLAALLRGFGHEVFLPQEKEPRELSARVIFTMSDARAAEVGPLLEQSGCEFVQKPFEVERFLGVVRRVLNHAEAVLLKGPSRH